MNISEVISDPKRFFLTLKFAKSNPSKLLPILTLFEELNRSDIENHRFRRALNTTVVAILKGRYFKSAALHTSFERAFNLILLKIQLQDFLSQKLLPDKMK